MIHNRFWKLAVLLFAATFVPSMALSRKTRSQRQGDVIVSHESFPTASRGIERKELAVPNRNLHRMGGKFNFVSTLPF